MDPVKMSAAGTGYAERVVGAIIRQRMRVDVSKAVDYLFPVKESNTQDRGTGQTYDQRTRYSQFVGRNLDITA